MTAFTTISNDLVAVGAKPFATTIQALRDNTLAIAEADSSVALGLLPTVLLGTATPAAVATSTLSSLVLTPYKFLIVDYTLTPTAGSNLAIPGVNIVTGMTGTFLVQGMALINISPTGRFINVSANNGSSAGSGVSTVTTASTSFAMSVSAGVMTGTWRLYGMK